MGFKIAFSGLVLSFLLLLPAVLKGSDPPSWFKAIVLTTGFVGIFLVFVGTLCAIWQ